MQFRKWLLILLAVGAVTPLVASAHSTQMPGETTLAQTGGFGPPVLVEPVDGGFSRHTRPSFRWISTQGAVSYQLQLSTSASFTTGVQTFAVPNPTYFSPSSSQPDGIYYWRMRAYNGTLYSDWGEQRQFEIDTVPPLAPVRLAPVSGSTFVGTPPTFSWEPVSDAGHYYIFAYNPNDGGGGFYVRVDAPATSFTPDHDIFPGPYVWYLDAVDAAGNSSTEVTSWNFTQLSAEDAAPELYFYGFQWNTEVPLRWSAVDRATVYHIQVARDLNFSDIVRENNTLTVPEDIHYVWRYETIRMHYWRVRAGQGNGLWGPWSDTSTFVPSSYRYYTPVPTARPTATPTLTPSPIFTPTATFTPSPTATPGG